MRDYLLALIPVFVAMDAIGVLPIFLSLTEGMPPETRRGVLKASILTALGVGVGFLFLGKVVFGVLGVTVFDFQVGGGLILLILAVHDILFPERKRRAPAEAIGVVPLGVPLIVGPAVMTTLLICHDLYGLWPTLFSLLVNLAFTWVLFWEAEWIVRVLGENGIRGVGKVTSVLLAAIAVMMIRKGILGMLELYR